MKHHAKASPAGSTSRGAGLGSSRRALATRAASRSAKGTGAPSPRRLTVLVLAVTAFLALAAAPAQAAKLPYFSFGSPGTRGGQFPTFGSAFGNLPSPAGSAVNSNGQGSGAAAGDVYVADREANRVQQFHANGDFVRAFGWDVVLSGQHNSGANEQQTVNVPNTVTGGAFKLTLAAATGIGTLAAGSKEVTGVVTNTGAFAVGQAISGGESIPPGTIPPGTTIAAVSGSTLVLSAAATASTPAGLSATETTASIEWNAPATGAGSLQQRLEALPSVGAGGATVTGGPGASGTPFTVTFSGGVLGHNNIAPLSVTESTLLGGSASVATVSDGGGFEICEAASSPTDVCQMGRASSAGGGMSLPQGIAVDQVNGNLFLTDREFKRVDEFSAAGAFIRAFGQNVVQTGKPNNANETQSVTVNASAGQFKLTFNAKTTTDLPFNATAAEVQSALNLLESVSTGGGSVSVAGGPGNVGGTTPYQVTFNGGPLAGTDVAQMTAAGGTTPLSGGSPSSSVTVATTNAGATGFEICNTAANCQTGTSAATAGAFASTFSGYLALAPPTAPNAGDVLVADPGNRRVQEFSPSGAFVRAFGFDVVSAGPDQSGTGFEVCRAASFDVCKIGTSGAGTGQFVTNGVNRVAEDSSGAIYTLENSGASNRRVQKFTPQAGPPPLSPSVFAAPILSTNEASKASTEIAIGAADHLFVVKAFPTEKRVLELNPAGTELLATDLEGSAIASVNGLSLDTGTGFTAGRMYVSSGSSAGGQQVHVFIDPPPHPPAVATGATSPTADPLLITLEGTVNPAEFKLSDCHFEYGTSTEYGTTSPCLPAAASLGEGTADLPVSAETEPLEPESTYHYRLVAENVGLPGFGEDRTFTTGPAPPDPCPNAARRAEQGIVALRLPDCMALEMVTPPHKFGAPAAVPDVSADGTRVSFQAKAALGETPPGLSFFPLYVATRGGSGWASESTFPDADPRFGDLWEASSQAHPSFTPDFSRWFGFGATAEQAQQGIGRAYEAGLGGFFRPLSAAIVPSSLGTTPDYPRYVVSTAIFQGASADHSHLYFSPGFDATYLPGDPNGGDAADANVYLARSGAGGAPAPLELLNRDRTGKVWGGNCAARLGGIGESSTSPNGERNQGAVSADGSRTYLSARVTQPPSGTCSTANKLRILERLETPAGPQIVPLFASECSRPSSPNPPGPCQELSGDDLYQGASLDQSKVYFTTNRQLADSDTDGSGAECSLEAAVAGCDLYLYDHSRPAGHHLVQVSAGEDVPGEHQKGSEADLYNGITAISADGSHVYFVATGVLTADQNPAGDSAQLGRPNLYLWQAAGEQTTFLATLAAPLGPDPGDSYSGESGLWGGNGTWRNDAYPVPVLSPAEQGGEPGEEGGDGHILVFQSEAELTPDDGDGRHRDTYRYDAAAETLACLSCLPGSSPAEPDTAPSDVDGRSIGLPPGTDFAERGRWVSEDGGEVGFATPQGLLPGDVNGELDAYLWRHGSLARLPGRPFIIGAGTQNKDSFLSHDGSTVAFATPTPLLPADGDTTSDVYVLRIGGGFPNPPPPQRCQGEECRGELSAPPQPSGAGTAVFEGPGNPKPHPCHKPKIRRRGHCVPRHTHRRHAKGSHRARHANTDRRAGK